MSPKVVYHGYAISSTMEVFYLRCSLKRSNVLLPNALLIYHLSDFARWRNNQPISGLMEGAWVFTVLYSGPLGLAVYWYSGRTQIDHDSLWRKGFRLVCHCYSGCGAGEITGIFIALGLLAADASLTHPVGGCIPINSQRGRRFQKNLIRLCEHLGRGTLRPSWTEVNTRRVGRLVMQSVSSIDRRRSTRCRAFRCLGRASRRPWAGLGR